MTTAIKLKCSKCGCVSNMSPGMLDLVLLNLGMDKKDYLSIYRCPACRIDRVLDWKAISAIEDLSERFIDKYMDRLFWGYISFYHVLTPEFVVKYMDKLTGAVVKNPTFDNLPDSLKLILSMK
jgi:hypothetical protein